MALMKMPTYAGGGGSVKSGTYADTSSASQKVEIETGLSSITRFVLTSQMAGYNTYQMSAVYDKDIDSSTYNSASPYSGGAYGGIASIGSAVANYCWKIDSIVDGKVTLYSPSQNTGWGSCENIKWFAE